MRRREFLGMMSLAALGPMLWSVRSLAKADARALLDRIDDLYRADQSHAIIEMKVVTPRYQRTLKIEGWTKGTDHALFRILSPKKEAGTATLRVENDLWNYLPRVRRTMRIPSSMMGGSWMGSDFTNDDLVKESRFTEDYDFRIGFEGKREGRSIVEIVCTPKPQAAVVWGQVTCEVDMARADKPLPWRIKYFDEKQKLARTMFFEDVGELDGRQLPTTMRLVPENKPGQFTEMHYIELDTRTKVPDRMFSLQHLKG